MVEPLDTKHKGGAFCSPGVRSKLMLEEAVTHSDSQDFNIRLLKKEKLWIPGSEGASL